MFRVANWVKNFENSKTKELKRLDWVPVPNKMEGAGYTELVDHPNGAAHLGAWLAILEIASRQTVRGNLPESSTGTAKALARISRLPVSIFEEVLPRLAAIGWVEQLTQENQQPDEIRQIPTDDAENPPLKGKGKGKGNGTEGEKDIASLASQAPPSDRPALALVPAKENSEKGARLTIEVLPDEWAEFALTSCGFDRAKAERVFAEFRDYWVALPGSKGRKSNWLATWRNRCRALSPARDGPKQFVDRNQRRREEAVQIAGLFRNLDDTTTRSM